MNRLFQSVRNARGIATSQVMKSSRSLVKLRKLQADFQCEDGKPVWLKGGICDRILYSMTIIGCYVGICMVLSEIYDLAKPASWKTDVC